MDINLINRKLNSIDQLVADIRGLVNETPDPPIPPEPPQEGDVEISRMVGQSMLTIRAAAKYAGAIDSLTWDGKEFISRTCTGDLLQTALAINDHAERENPTEAGNRSGKPSKLISMSGASNILNTKCQMMYYLSPGEISNPNGEGPQTQPAVNTTELSDYTLTKKVTIGHASSDHVVEFLLNIHIPENCDTIIEALTGYMPSEFSEFWVYDHSAHSLFPISAGPGEQSLPLVFSSGESHAMGCYCPDLPIPGKYRLLGYGRSTPPHVAPGMVKWNMVFRMNGLTPGDYTFRCYVIVGSLENVRVSMIQLHNYFADNPSSNFPPTKPGLSLVLDLKDSKRCLFTGARFKSGLLLGDYGYHVGGGRIQYFDGAKVTTEATFSNPLAESVFHIITADDGVPIASCEKWGMMQRRQPDSKWKMTFGGGQGDIPTVENDLCFGIFKSGSTLCCFVYTFGETLGDGFMIKSTDNGKSWQRDGDYGNRLLYCANSDGNRILLAGERDGHPWIIDKGKSTIAERPDLKGKRYSQLCGRSGRWNFAGDAFIDYWEGGTPRTVFTSDREYAMWTECDPKSSIRVALFSTWNGSATTSQLAISRDDGKTWPKVISVPCPCILGVHFADGGVYIFGGKYQDYGRVYFYKF